MLDIGTIRASVKLDYDSKGLSRLDSDMGRVDKSMGGLEKRSSKLGNTLKRGLKVGALAAGAALTTGLAVSLKKAVTNAKEAEKIGRQTEAVIKSTGQAANVTADDVQNLASAIQKKTAVDDEATKSSSNLLLTFKNVQNSADGSVRTFDRAQEAIVDMAAGMNNAVPTAAMLKSSTIQLGKALNDPIKGMAALSKVGVQFNEEQKATIEGLIESGQLQKAQGVILKEVEGQFKGSAEAQATAMDHLRETWNDFLEEVGKKILPVMEKAAAWMEKFISEIMEGTGAGGDFRNTMESLWKTLQNLWPTIRTIGSAIGKLIKGFASLPAPVQTALLSLGLFAGIGAKLFGLVKIFGAVKWAATGLFTTIRMAPLAMGVAGIALMALVGIAYLIIKNWDKVKGFLGKTWSWIKNAAGDLAKWVADKARKGFLGPLPLIISRWRDILGFIRQVPGKIGGFLSNLGRIIISPFKWAADQIKNVLDRIIGFFDGAIKKIKGVVGGVGNVIGAVGNVLGFAEGGPVGPGAGGARFFMAGEGNKKEWVISQEGNRRKNQAWAMEAASALGIPGFKKGGKPADRISQRIANLQQNMSLKRREFELSGGKLTAGEMDRLIKLNEGIQAAIRELIQVSKGQAKKDARFALRDAQLERRALVAEKSSIISGNREVQQQAFTQTPNVDAFIDDLQTQLALAEAGYGGDPESIREQLKKRLEQKLAILRNKLSQTTNRDQISALNDAIRGTLGELSSFGSGAAASGPSFIEQVGTAAQLRYEALAGFGSNAMQMGLGSGGRTLAKAGGTTVVLNGEFKLDGNDPHSSVRKLGYQIANNLA
jgi:hypothetical protein